MVPLGLFPMTFFEYRLNFYFFFGFLISLKSGLQISLILNENRFGVMLDDVVAGIYTVLAVYFINKLLYAHMIIL